MPTATDLILGARQKANVERSKFVSDTEVLGYVNERLQSLRDRMVEADPSYYHGQADLTFNNPAGHPAGSAPLPPDLYKIRGVSMWPDTPNARSIRPLAFSVRDGVRDAGYVLDGTCISIVPYMEANRGPVRLYYTPALQPLAVPLTVDTTPVVTSIPNPSDAALGFGVGGTTFHATLDGVALQDVFRASDVGQTLTVAGAVNSDNNGSFDISSYVNMGTVGVAGSHTLEGLFETAAVSITRKPQVVASTGTWYAAGFSASTQKPGDALVVSGSSSNDGTRTILTVGPGFVTTAPTGLTDEIFSGSVTLSTQPAGTVGALDVIMTAFAAYLTIGAAISIATKMQKTDLVSLLTTQFAAEESRVDQMAANRAGETEAIAVLWHPSSSVFNPFGVGGDWY